MLAFGWPSNYRGGVSIVRAFALICFFLGLFVQSAAQAAVAPPMETTQAVDCSEMGDGMAQSMATERTSDEQPCDGMTLDCLIAMGCLAPIAMPDADIADLPVLTVPRSAYLPGNLSGLKGRLLTPESPPPQVNLDI